MARYGSSFFFKWKSIIKKNRSIGWRKNKKFGDIWRFVKERMKWIFNYTYRDFWNGRSSKICRKSYSERCLLNLSLSTKAQGSQNVETISQKNLQQQMFVQFSHAFLSLTNHLKPNYQWFKCTQHQSCYIIRRKVKKIKLLLCTSNTTLFMCVCMCRNLNGADTYTIYIILFLSFSMIFSNDGNSLRITFTTPNC